MQIHQSCRFSSAKNSPRRDFQHKIGIRKGARASAAPVVELHPEVRVLGAFRFYGADGSERIDLRIHRRHLCDSTSELRPPEIRVLQNEEFRCRLRKPGEMFRFKFQYKFLTGRSCATRITAAVRRACQRRAGGRSIVDDG
ncbi:hypothetical protein EVAR_34426_1 [Eumeta japonica]|uniref:Uncharacterized protein n=1 Tax=Eumeta variegata TaxID=151549 RepID=A0A4C1WL16_EUMVA|nr:hypothetical protein EVAR_34426_1 [Eumeta japonica]